MVFFKHSPPASPYPRCHFDQINAPGEVQLADFGLAARTKTGPFAQMDGCGTEVRLQNDRHILCHSETRCAWMPLHRHQTLLVGLLRIASEIVVRNYEAFWTFRVERVRRPMKRAALRSYTESVCHSDDVKLLVPCAHLTVSMSRFPSYAAPRARKLGVGCLSCSCCLIASQSPNRDEAERYRGNISSSP